MAPVRFGYGWGMERFERFHFSVLAGQGGFLFFSPVSQPETVPVPVSVPGKTAPAVPVSPSVPGSPCSSRIGSLLNLFANDFVANGTCAHDAPNL